MQGRGRGHRAQSTREGVIVGADFLSFAHQEPTPSPTTPSRWTLKRLGIYLIHLPNTGFVPIDVFHIN